MSLAIQVNNMSYKYEKKKNALNDITFSVKKGSFHGLIGANGSGKSTIIKLLIRALTIQKGEILFNGCNVDDKKNNKTIVSFFPDESRFPIGFSVFDYIKNEVNILKSIKSNFLKDKVQKLLNDFSIPDVMKKSPNDLSSGQKKKIELIRLMLEEPEIVILDEPTNFLDPQTREILFECLKWFNQKGVTIFISSHILQELKYYIDSATIIDYGEVKFTGDVHDDDIMNIYNEINSGKLEVFQNEKI